MKSTATNRRQWRAASTAAIGAIALSLAMAAPSLQAQVSTYGSKGLPAMTTAMSAKGGQADTTPTILKKVGIDQNLNAQLPLDLKFTDDHGQLVPLSAYFGKLPAIFLPFESALGSSA